MSDPALARWQPSRAGIRNIWEYDNQVFEFADGRLVLRGPNGSGKSNALALFVPFLLDGIMAGSRMDSLSGGRSMKTLLLCLADDEQASRFRHEQRAGYTWLEFERGDDHMTVGCGARASTQRDAEPWFFVTPRRPEIDFELAPGGIPLSRGALADVLGSDAVHESAESYRAAVDQALFGLGPHRYRNLVELLLVLRRPHLAAKLHLDHLSKVLSDGLAALDERLIADVAASFEDLEAVQRDLRRLKEANRTVQRFLPVYRRYLRAVARTRALAAHDAIRALRAARRRVTDAEKALAATDIDVDRVQAARRAGEESREIAEQRHRAVLESPAYRDATSLVEIEARTADAERALQHAEARLASAETEERAAAAERAEAATERAGATSELDRTFRAVAETADVAGVAWSVRREDVESHDLAEVLRGAAGQRRQEIATVRAALAEAERARTQADAAGEASERAAVDAGRADDLRRQAGDTLDEARAHLHEAVRLGVRASEIPELEPVVDLAGAVGEPGETSVADAVAEALRPREHKLAVREARAADLASSLIRERDDVVDERRRVADDPVPAPDRLSTRPADRSARAGAPLYACCDFAEHVAPSDRAGLEAAIEAAGLLDAWVGETSDDLDAWLHALPPADGPTLADVLVPTPPDRARITADAVSAVLASISLADADVAVQPDGRFRLGPLRGRFAKPDPEFIGATAREQHRLRLLATLDQRIADVDERLASVTDERRRVVEERRHIGEVSASLPSSAAVLTARDALISAVATANTRRDAATRAAAIAADARKAALARLDHVRTVAATSRVPATPDGLAELDVLVHGFEQHANTLVHAVERLFERRHAEARAAERVVRAGTASATGRTERDEQQRRAIGLRARVEQLRSQLGADAEAPLRELEAIEAELGELRQDADRLCQEADVVAERRGRAQQERESAISAVTGHESVAAETATRLEVLRRDDVWALVAPRPSDPIPPDASQLAAAVVDGTADVSGDADDNALQRGYRLLLDELGRGYDPSLSYVDHVAVVDVTSDMGTFSVLWLGDQLGDQVARQQELLSERDREIFERHLLTRVSEALRELLNDADELVERINRSLADRPTASGKSVQLRWELETTDPAVRGALALLRKTPDLLGPDERDQLRRFFSTAIDQRRAEDPASGYAEILRHVLDYRAWHVFVPRVRSASGGIQRLTRTLFRSLSGGEQAVVLHLPLFAAAAAHYDAARPGAPRLIALDEAFAGIDEGMRAELMGLLVRFDLDIVLTGHELWGAYEQVPALMVYDLLRQPPLEGVSAFAVRWDGAAMAEV